MIYFLITLLSFSLIFSQDDKTPTFELPELILVDKESDSGLFFSGDARFRPRLDKIEWEASGYDGTSSSDFYYMYRARINMKAVIGGGWFFNTKLGTNDLAATPKIAEDGEYTSGSGNLNSMRPQVDFLELYFGLWRDNYGFWMGAFPLKGNSALDIHYYPEKLVEIPWTIYNNNSVTGFAGYKFIKNYKYKWFCSIDRNVNNIEAHYIWDDAEEFTDDNGNGIWDEEGYCYNDNFLTEESCEDAGWDWIEEEFIDENGNELWDDGEQLDDMIETNTKDTFTLGLSTTYDLGLLSISPRYYVTMDDNQNTELITQGADIAFSSIGGFYPSLSYHTSTNYRNEATLPDHYLIDHMRIQLIYPFEKGKLKIFYDVASKKLPVLEEESTLKFLWLSYSHLIFKSEKGSVIITPTFRLRDGEDYIRSKFELTTEIKFN